MTLQPQTHHKRLLDLLSHVGQIVSSAKSLDTMVYATVNLIKTMMDVERCSILIIDPDSQLLRLKAASNIPPEEWDKIRVPLGEGISGHVAQTGKPLLVSDVMSSDYAAQSKQERYSSTSFICMPLIVKARTIGVINVNNKSDTARFGPDDLDLVSGLAGLIALAIDNARLMSASDDARAQLETIVESLPQAVFTVGINGRITLCNMRLVRLLGLPPDSPMEGRSMEELLPPALLNTVVTLQRETIDYAVDTRTEVEVALPGQGTVPLEINISPLTDATGRVDGILGTFLDASIRREVTELRRLDELKSNFMSLVSHELRTPLTAIKGAVHLMMNPAGGTANDSSRGLANIVHNNTERLIRLVNDLLDMVNIENKALAVLKRPEDLGRLMDGCLAAYRPAAAAKSIRLQEEIAADVTASVDRHRLHQAVCHLVDNAIKFTQRGGSILVSLKKTGDRAIISVKDTGCGISPDAKEKLFTRFYQAQDPLTRSCGGTGIGLYMAKSIVELHGGHVTAGPASKDGAEFVIELPLDLPVLAGS